MRSAISVTEPGAGSDVAGITTRAERVAGGYKLNGSKFFATNSSIADMATKNEAARLLIYKAAAEADAGIKGKELALIEAIANLFATDVAMEVATDAVQLFDYSGISKDNRIEQYFGDAEVLQIIEGTNQIQRNIIAKHVVKTY